MKKTISLITVLCLLLTLFTGCGSTSTTEPDPTLEPSATDATTTTESEPVEHIYEGESVEEIIKNLTLEEKIWQMMFVTPENICGIGKVVQAGEATKNALQECPVGGLIYFGQNIESKEQLSQMLENTKNFSVIPPFLSIDEEGGRVARLGDADIGTTKHPAMAEIGKTGDPENAREVGITLGKELTELGFNTDFAPVADILAVKTNQDIGDRSFGTDPDVVASMVTAQVEGMQSQNLSATLKHFPGCASTDANTHVEAGASVHTLDQMRKAEFVPFKAGIEAGADFVMVAHVSAPAITGDNTPATLSSQIVTDLLRKELNFQKVIITDAMNMGAISSLYEAEKDEAQKEAIMEDIAVRTVEAGIDMLLMFPDVHKAVAAIKNAVESGRISESRIDESVHRILTLKQERGILY